MAKRTTRSIPRARSNARTKRAGWPLRSIEAVMACSRIALPPAPAGMTGRHARSIAATVRKFYLG